MCDTCDGLCEIISIKHPYQYHSIVDQSKVMLKEGILVIIEGNCDFNEIDRTKPFPNDVLYHVFKCTSCGQRFSLCVETYHGSGGSWEVIHD